MMVGPVSPKIRPAPQTRVSTLHRDAQGSIRALTTAAGLEAEKTVYSPFGDETPTVNDMATAPETKGYIDERFDAGAGLQYLNARYFDPKLGLFLQPDCWDVTQAGVGTNMYTYSGNDPVNGSDAGGQVKMNISFTAKSDKTAYKALAVARKAVHAEMDKLIWGCNETLPDLELIFCPLAFSDKDRQNWREKVRYNQKENRISFERWILIDPFVPPSKDARATYVRWVQATMRAAETKYPDLAPARRLFDHLLE